MPAEESSRAREIGERIISARKEQGMTQEEVAELVGASVRSMQAYESGEVIPYRKLRELEAALGRPMSWILHGEEAHDWRDQQLDEIRDKLEAIASANDRRDEILSTIAETNSAILQALKDLRGE